MAQSARLPTEDEFFGGPAPRVPTEDEFFGGPAPQPRPPYQTGAGEGGAIWGAPDMDAYFSEGGPGAILDRFGQGFRENWGAGSLDTPNPTFGGKSPAELLRGWGAFRDVQNERFNIYKAFNEGLLRSTAFAWDIATKVPYAAARGLAEAFTSPTTGQEMLPGVGAPAALMEAFPGGHLTGFPVAPGVSAPRPAAPVSPEVTAAAIARLAPGEFHRDLARAHDLGVIGAPESAYRDLGPSRAPISYEISGQAEGQMAYPDIHAAARRVAPDTFTEYDALDAQKTELRNWIDELDEQRHRGISPQITALDEGIQRARAEALQIPPAKRAEANNRITDLESRRAALVDQLPAEGDTAEMAVVRRSMMEADERMRDLAPQVSAAYRQARTEMPPDYEQTISAGIDRRAAAEAVQPPEAPAATPVAAEAEQAAPAPPRAAPVDIAADISRQLVAAGRPAEEADAAGQLYAARYQARAAALGGTATPEELYARDAATVRAGRGVRAQEPALAQDEELEQSRRGYYTYRGPAEAARSEIVLLKHANASTFLHESGHQFLNELMRDARDANAMDQLRADAATVRNWLGVDEGFALGEKLTKAEIDAHEQFARGFERYLMEGHAPSQRLAGVFAKFKQWLLQLYQTADRLRSPINDDIRRVFDRMLATKDEEPVIAPERMPAETFADLHEEDATVTAPYRAAVSSREIRDERDRVIEAAHRETEDERLAGREVAEQQPVAGGVGRPRSGIPASEAGGGAVGGAVHGAGGAPGRIEPTAAGRIQGGGQERPGGGGAPPESHPVPGGQSRPGAVSGGPNVPLPADERYVDKSGNIRLDKFQTPDDVKAYIREFGEEHENFIAARRGVVSDQQVLDTAAAMGLRPQDLNVASLRANFSPERLTAVRNLFVATSDEAHRLSKDVEFGGEQAIEAYMQARSRLRMVQEYLSAITAESGRTMRAFRVNIAGMEEAKTVAERLGDLGARKSLDQIRDEAIKLSQLQTAAQAAGFIRNVDKPGLGEMVFEVFTNWLISNPITHAGYAAGNAVLGLNRALIQTPFAAGFTSLRSLMAGHPIEGTSWGQVGAQLYGMMHGQRNGFRAAWDAFQSGETQAVPLEAVTITPAATGGYDIATGTHLGTIHVATLAEAKQLAGRGAGQVTAAGGVTTPYTQTKAIPNFTVAGVSVPLGSAVRVPGERMVAPIHSYFRAVNYEAAISDQAYQIAANEGLTGNAFKLRLADLEQNPTLDMMQQAKERATNLTLMGRGGPLTSALTQFVNWAPRIPLLGPTRIARFIDPFVHISSNILEMALREGPLGPLFENVRDDLSGRNGNIAQSTAVGRVAGGTALALVGGGLAFEGILNYSGPSDPNERRIWQMANGMPHSVVIGDLSYSLHGFGPLGLQLGIAADLTKAAEYGAKGEVDKVAGLLVQSIATNFLDESFMRGPAEFLQVLEDPGRYANRWVSQFIANLAVPYSMGSFAAARQIDPYMREARTVLDTIRQRIPWESETLPAQYDVWGNPIPNRAWYGAYAQRLNEDKATQALLASGYFPAPVKRDINGIELTPEQHADYARRAGRLAKMMVDLYVNSPGFDQLPPELRHNTLQHEVTKARSTVAEQIKFESMGTANDIVAKATQAKTDVISGATHEQIRKEKRLQ